MARKRDPNRDKAFELYKENAGSITNREIAEQLNVDEKKIAVWKGRDKWSQQLDGDECCTTKKRTTTNKNKQSIRSKQRQQIIDALVEAGTYSPALDLLIEIYLDAYEEYIQNGKGNEKLRKELAKYLGQLGLDGKNKELIKKSGVLLAKGDEEKEKEKEPAPAENSKLVQFRQRMQR